MLLVAWLPALYMGAAFLFYEQWMGQMERQDEFTAAALQRLKQAGEEFDPDSTPEKIVFNHTVSLRDSWAKIEKKLAQG